MSTFVGSVSFTESKFFGTVGYLPKPYDLSLFLYKRLRKSEQHPNAHQKLLQCMQSYENIYKPIYEKQPLKEEKGKVGNLGLCAKDRMSSSFAKDLIKPKLWNLPPNIYEVKDGCVSNIIEKQMGTKGPYYSSTERSAKSYYGYCTLPKLIGTTKHYDIPSQFDQLDNYCNKHRMKFLSNAREQRPYLRFMVSNLSLCWKNPNEPGPENYYPKNYCLDRKIAVNRIKDSYKPRYNFLPNSSVLTKDLSYYKIKNTPDPCRYTITDIGCPCGKNKIFQPDIWREIEINKRKKFRRESYIRIKESKYCKCPIFRNIPGHGHSSVFQSKLRHQPIVKPYKKLDKPGKLHHNSRYYQMITNPKRVPISLPTIDLELQPAELKFNSIIKPKPHCKLNINKRVAFMSSVLRFKDMPQTEVTKVDNMKKIKINIQLNTLPSRFLRKQVKGTEKLFSFQPLLAARIFDKDGKISTISQNHRNFNKEPTTEDFLKKNFE